MKTYGRCLKSSFSSREQNLPDEYENACRLCLTKDNVTVNIYSDDVVPVSLKLRDCVALEVMEDDGLPRSVCTDCASKLDNAYTFKMQCHATDVKLRQFIKVPSFSHSFSLDCNLKETTLLEDSENDKSRDACTIKMEDNCLICPRDLYVNNSTNKRIDASKKDKKSFIIENVSNSDDIFFDVVSESGEFVPVEIVKVDKSSATKKDPCNEENNISSRVIEEKHLFEEDDDEVFLENRRSARIFFSRKRKLLPSSSSSVIPISNEDKSSELSEEKTSLLRKKKKPLYSSRTNYRCPSCYSRYLSYKELFNHIHLNHIETLKRCNVCRKSFISSSTLERHMRTHTGERPFECQECGKRFSQKEILNRHYYTHTEDKPFKCKHCNFSCSYSEKLNLHIITYHSDNPENKSLPKFQCTKCDKSFCHASGLSRHQVTHSGITFQCTICEKIFSDKSSVKRHQVKIHPEGLFIFK